MIPTPSKIRITYMFVFQLMNSTTEVLVKINFLVYFAEWVCCP